LTWYVFVCLLVLAMVRARLLGISRAAVSFGRRPLPIVGPRLMACQTNIAMRSNTTLAAHGLKTNELKGANYNPEWTPLGFEGAVDSNTLPFIDIPQMPGCSMKPLRVSKETGAFTVIVKMKAGTTQPTHVLLGASDTFILSGKLTYTKGPLTGEIGPGVWGYSPANAKMEGTTATEDTEYLATFHAPIAFLKADGSVDSLLTGADVMNAAYARGIPLIPLSLEESMQDKPPAYTGHADKLNCSESAESWARISHAETPIVTELTNPHYVDTNAIPWIVNPEAPEIALKVMRVSTETGTVSLIVRQNGQAPPHYHLGAGDFFITSGRIGYRAGPPEGYGPGVYFWEPAGARHESTTRVGEEDLIYTANLYGPIQFDSGIGTPVLLVQSWMQYLEAAKAFNSPLLASTFPDDATTLLAPSI